MQIGAVTEEEGAKDWSQGDNTQQGQGNEEYPYYPEGGGDTGYLWALKGGNGK